MTEKSVWRVVTDMFGHYLRFNHPDGTVSFRPNQFARVTSVSRVGSVEDHWAVIHAAVASAKRRFTETRFGDRWSDARRKFCDAVAEELNKGNIGYEQEEVDHVR